MCRLWDVLFLGELEDRIATSSEDGTIKVWDLKRNECVMTLRGHASDVWCLTSISGVGVKSHEGLGLGLGCHLMDHLMDQSADINASVKKYKDDLEQIVLFSGGNDGSVKAWPLASHAICSPENPSASLNHFAIPHCTSHEATVGIGSRRSNGISSLKLSKDGQWSIICMCNGGIWIVSYSGRSMTSSENDGQSPCVGGGGGGGGVEASISRDKNKLRTPFWHYLGCCDKAITTADAHFVENFNSVCNMHGDGSDKTRLFVIVSCAHPDGFLTLWEVSADKKSLEESIVIHSKKHSWKAHDVRAINVWYADVKMTDAECSSHYLVTTSVKGICKLWGQDSYSSGSTVPNTLLLEFVTGKGQVATCCMLQTDMLVIGDTRGGISIYKINEVMLIHNPKSISTTIISPSTFISSAHGIDLVSCVVPNYETGGFFSTGHDGNFNTYNSSGQLTNKLKCLPIKSPDQIFLIGTGNNLSIYIGGYLGGQYLVYDIRKGYQIMRVEGGGWKR